jgi:11-cis-retinol dehydrogenase
MTSMYVVIGVTLILYVIYRLYQHLFPSPNVDSRGKYVLISGCDSGFGHALAIDLDKQGFNVLAGVYDTDNEVSLGQRLSSRATVFCLDITRQEQIDAAYEMVKSKTKSLHALVNNAGISSLCYIDWLTMESMRKMMDINFFGHVTMTKKFLPLLIAKRDSRVVNICSVAGIVGMPSGSAYCASKYALESFSDCLRREMAVWGLRVSIIEPSYMRTPIIEGHEQAVRTLWASLSDDTKERWGKDFLDSRIEKLRNNVLVQNAENPNKVVRSLQHAVMNTVPCIRYRPGWQSKFIFFPLSMCPAWVTDLFLAKTSTPRILPASVGKQIKE